MDSHEAQAIALSNDKKRLLKRLKDAKSILANWARKDFGKGTYDFDKKRLIGDNGIILQWQLRHSPELPESPDNQQTTGGCVTAITERSQA